MHLFIICLYDCCVTAPRHRLSFGTNLVEFSNNCYEILVKTKQNNNYNKLHFW